MATRSDPLRFEPASALPLAVLTDLFNQGYSGYYVPVRLEEPGFRDMLVLFDVDLSASRVAFDAEGPVAFALLAIRGKRGWIGGMGVPPAARGAGHGRAVMQAVLEEARGRGLAAVDLEVLVQNAPAIAIYEALGFRDVRPFDVWVRKANAADANAALGTVEGVAVGTLDVAACLSRHGQLHEFEAPWQRALPVLERLSGSLEARGILRGGEPACWMLYRTAGGQVRIADIALAADAPPAWLEATVAAVVRENPDADATLVNLPEQDRCAAALAACGFEVKLRQREMRTDR